MQVYGLESVMFRVVITKARLIFEFNFSPAFAYPAVRSCFELKHARIMHMTCLEGGLDACIKLRFGLVFVSLDLYEALSVCFSFIT